MPVLILETLSLSQFRASVPVLNVFSADLTSEIASLKRSASSWAASEPTAIGNGYILMYFSVIITWLS